MAKFQPGQSGNPKGRPPLTVEQKRVKALTARLKSRDFLDIVDKVIVLAKRGERWAVELLFKYQIGLPKQSIELEQIGDQKIIVEYVNQIGTSYTPQESDTDNSG